MFAVTVGIGLITTDVCTSAEVQPARVTLKNQAPVEAVVAFASVNAIEFPAVILNGIPALAGGKTVNVIGIATEPFTFVVPVKESVCPAHIGLFVVKTAEGTGLTVTFVVANADVQPFWVIVKEYKPLIAGVALRRVIEFTPSVWDVKPPGPLQL